MVLLKYSSSWPLTNGMILIFDLGSVFSLDSLSQIVELNREQVSPSADVPNQVLIKIKLLNQTESNWH